MESTHLKHPKGSSLLIAIINLYLTGSGMNRCAFTHAYWRFYSIIEIKMLRGMPARTILAGLKTSMFFLYECLEGLPWGGFPFPCFNFKCFVKQTNQSMITGLKSSAIATVVPLKSVNRSFDTSPAPKNR